MRRAPSVQATWIPAAMLEPALGHAIVAVFALERLGEAVFDAANVRRLAARGGTVVPNCGVAWTVAVHALWLVALASERLLFDARMGDSGPLWALAPALLLVEAARVWVLATLGRRWTLRVVVVPGERPIARGPYRYLKHPNYAVVIAEVLLVPLLVGAWRTALVGSLVQLPVLLFRQHREEEAWRRWAGAPLGSRS